MVPGKNISSAAGGECKRGRTFCVSLDAPLEKAHLLLYENPGIRRWPPDFWNKEKRKKVKLLVELDAFKGELTALEKPLVEVRDSL